MKLLPFENYTLLTTLSVDEVRRRISDNIEPNRKFRFAMFRRSSTKPYEGQLLDGTFIINRIISYRNSFLPIITGRISNGFSGTEIKIKMRPHIFVLIFMSFWLGIVGLICLALLATAIAQFRQVLKRGFSPIILIPFGMFIFGCGLITIGFKSESKNSKEFLATLFEAHEINTPDALY